MSLIGNVMRFFFERSAKNKSLDELIVALEQDKTEVAAKMRDKADTAKNRQVASHIIAIERWGQRRLQTLNGASPIQDENDAYAPDATLTLSQLADAFAETRDGSVALAKELQAAGVAKAETAAHNDAGDMTLGAWLVYFNGHAKREAGQIK